MPIDKLSLAGKEKDGSLNEDYCIFCYNNGVFTAPDITVEAMQEFVKKVMTDKMMPKHLVDTAVNTIPHLRRWNVAID